MILPHSLFAFTKFLMYQHRPKLFTLFSQELVNFFMKATDHLTVIKFKIFTVFKSDLLFVDFLCYLSIISTFKVVFFLF